MEQSLIAYQYNTDKSQLYLNNYERHFGHIADQEIKLLELGIHKGGSLLLWRDFFRNGTVVGLDLQHVNIDDPTGRIHVYQGDQRDLNLLDRMATECASDGYDIIIDDASHIAAFTKISFWHLFDNYLKPGGSYVIEDWRVGYWERWPDGLKYESQTSTRTWPHRLLQLRKHKSPFPSHTYGMVGLVKQLMDELGMDAITNPARGGFSPQRLPKFQRMEVCPGQVFIVKATKQDHKLIAEQLHGVPEQDRLMASSRKRAGLEKLDSDLGGALLYTNDSRKESSNHDKKTEKEPRSSVQGKGGIGSHQGRTDTGGIGRALPGPPQPDRGVEEAAS